MPHRDGSVFTGKQLWTVELINEVKTAFVDHPDYGSTTFLQKLEGQMQRAGSDARQLCAEMLWVLLLFPTNVAIPTKVNGIKTIWEMSSEPFPIVSPNLSASVLLGVGSGGPGYNTYRPDELEFLIGVTLEVKRLDHDERKALLQGYERFCEWIRNLPLNGRRQFRHMLRFFAFPEQVERISSNNDRRRILDGFGRVALADTKSWTDRQLDTALLELRRTRGTMAIGHT